MKITKFFKKLTDAVWYRECLYLKYGRENVRLVDYPLFWGEPGTYIFELKNTTR